MADRTVRAIFEARVSGAQKGMRDLATDVDKAGRKVDDLTRDLRTLDKQDAKPTIDVAIEAAKADVEKFRDRLTDLEAKPTTPKVDADITEARRRLDDAESRLGALQGAKAEMVVTADTSPAEREIDSLGGEGEQAGEDAGEGLSKGIIAALATIPIAGAIVGIGAAIGTALMAGIKDGLQVEATQDLFSARTGLDEATSRRFGRAAGEAYANAWGDSVEANLDTARTALEQGLIDADATEAEVERVIASLSGITDIMEADIPAAARAAGQMIKAGLADNAEDAFDIIVAGYQNGADASQDFLDTLTEYSTHFRDMGLSGEEATGLLIQGMDGAAFNADKVADALKELSIKVKELDETAGPALEQLGLDGEAMSRAFSEGGPPAREALDQILTALSSVEDPAERSRLAVELFGTQAEDMAAALGGLNLSTAVDQIGGVEGAAGAAERALATMSDNAATQIESAKRNIEIAADGIKGALAAAFSDEISGAAEWVQRNRGPVMQFLADIVVGILDFASSAVEGTATAYEAFASFAASAGIPVLNMLASIAEAIEKALPGDQGGAEFREFADDAILNLQRLNTEAPAVADGMRDTFGGAIDRMRTKFEEWAGPEILKAQVHDAVLAATERLDELGQAIDSTEGTVTINGDSLNAEDALALLVDNIDEETGTVTIDGNEVPADEALDVLMDAINTSKGDVTIGGDNQPAKDETDEAKRYASATIGRMTLDADTAAAEAAINYAARRRTVYVDVRVSGSSLSAIPTHDGGWTGRLPGRNAGGWVPGSDPGYDNILWPLYTGGTVLNQPLAGDEFVVNSTDARFWGPLLEWMNAGGRPPAAQQDGGGGAEVAKAVAQALQGATLTLTGVDYLSNATAARINTAIARRA